MHPYFCLTVRRAVVLIGALNWCPFVVAAWNQNQPAELPRHAHLIDECSSHAPSDCGKAERACLLDDLHVPVPASPPGSDAGAMPRGELDDTDVLHNSLDFELNPPAHSIAGSNTMTIRSLVDNLTHFTIRLASNLTISAVTVNGTVSIDPATLTPSGVYGRVIPLDRAYARDEEFTLRVDYNGVPQGAAFGSITINSALSYSLSEPFYAATWWPCKDGDVGAPGDNSDKATLDIYITVPADQRAVSSGLLQSIDELDQNRRRYHWHTDYPMATYLVSFAASAYNTWTRTYTYPGGTMPVEFNGFTDGASGGLAILDMLEVFRTRFGLYPFIEEKYGVYRFGFGGGMEHQTNTGQDSLGSTSLSAHELTHQWFGDAMTCRTWRDIWLNEGFATYGAGLWAEFRPGSSGHSALTAYMLNRRPLDVNDTVYCYDTSNWGRIFNGGMSYSKGAWVLHMLRHMVGDQTFWDILTDYRETWEGSAATTDDFCFSASQTTGIDLSPYFEQWVYQPGNPRYEFAIRLHPVLGQNYAQLMIQQTQNASWPTFDMPIDVRIGDAPNAPVVVVRNNARVQHYLIPTTATSVSGSALDPDLWLLMSGGNEAPYVAGPPKLVRYAPAIGQEYSAGAAPTEIRVTFSDDVNIQPGDIELIGPGGSVAFALNYVAADWTAVLTPQGALIPGSYSVTINDSITSRPEGIALDGELPFLAPPVAPPSGDGIPGGDATWSFLVHEHCPADFNGDHVVDLSDLAILLANFGTTANAIAGDLDQDQDVDLQDLATFLGEFGRFCI